ncbi:glycosyltransferase family 4 protein [uncultured Ruegeria sp.]|uniref:glycosyltransferase family 4 protein n=1 Tax=uncultured Ruegeria sp. TaxID=259304 RepID=UPI002601B96A|nr:glycosyltransferase family 4 protein [uncultured Ruegeria sp.]
MSGIHGKSPKTVFCLTYHEITADARVLKEARAVRSAGHNVHIFCDWPGGLPQEDSIDGIRVTRFNWQSSDHITDETLNRFFFVDRISNEIGQRVTPYIEAAIQLNAAKSKFRAFLTEEEMQILDPMYYKHCIGRERRVRKFAHKQLLWKTKLKYGFGEIRRDLNSFGSKSREVREKFFNLYQLNSLIFAENICSLDFDETPDVIHAHDIYCLPAGVALAKQFQATLVYDAHEYEPARATKNPLDGSNFAEELEDDCLPHVDHMITVSSSIAELYAERFKGQPTLILNAPEIDLDYMVRRKSEALDQLSIRDRANVADDTPLVIFTGGIQMGHRGLDKVLQALAHLPDVKLATMGPRHQRNDKWFMSEARKIGVSDRITLLPPVEAPDVPIAISTADLAICPFQDVSLNHRYAMPNKLFEAAFAGLPMCVSDLPEMRRFVETLGFGRAMDETDPVGIAEAIRDVLDHPENYMMTDQNKQTLWEIYSWSAQAKRLSALYAKF